MYSRCPLCTACTRTRYDAEYSQHWRTSALGALSSSIHPLASRTSSLLLSDYWCCTPTRAHYQSQQRQHFTFRNPPPSQCLPPPSRSSRIPLPLCPSPEPNPSPPHSSGAISRNLFTPSPTTTSPAPPSTSPSGVRPLLSNSPTRPTHLMPSSMGRGMIRLLKSCWGFIQCRGRRGGT